MKKKKPQFEIVDVRLPKELRDKLCRRDIIDMLESCWLEAYSRGAEFGMTLIANAKKVVAENKKKKKRSRKR